MSDRIVPLLDEGDAVTGQHRLMRSCAICSLNVFWATELRRMKMKKFLTKSWLQNLMRHCHLGDLCAIA
jgi:hypothetical protein